MQQNQFTLNLNLLPAEPKPVNGTPRGAAESTFQPVPFTPAVGILDQLQEAICLVNRHFRVLYWNASMAAMSGIPRSDALNQCLFALLPGDFEVNLQPLIAQVFTTEGEFSGEFRQSLDKKEHVAFRYRIGKFMAVHAEPLVMISFLDITDRLRVMKEKARQEHFAAIGSLSVNVAQELAEPLDGICRRVEKAREALHTANPLQANEHLDSIIMHAYRISSLAHNLVALVQQPVASTTRVHLNEIIHDVFDGIKREHRGRMPINLNLQQNLPAVLGDPSLLFAAFQILLPIAIEFAGDDAVPRAKTKFNEKTDRVRVIVEDRGPGFPEEELNRLFEHYCGSNCITPGASLGLFIVKKIIEALRGQFQMLSGVGKGTTFIIDLPAERARKLRDGAKILSRAA